MDFHVLMLSTANCTHILHFFFSWDSSIMMFNLILYLYIIYIDIYILFTNQQKKCASFALQKIPFSLPFLFPSF